MTVFVDDVILCQPPIKKIGGGGGGDLLTPPHQNSKIVHEVDIVVAKKYDVSRIYLVKCHDL